MGDRGLMAHWLVKSEPGAFSWDQQVANGVEPWTGVRNHMARNNLRAMRLGDRAFFYHSNVGKQIVGMVEVVREAYPDPSVAPDEKGDWSCVDMRAIAAMPRPVTLAELKADPAFATLPLIRQSRLSVMSINEADWTAICRLGGWMEPKRPHSKKNE